MQRYSFFPKSESKVIFVLATVCFTWTLTSLLRTVVDAVHFVPPGPGLFTVPGKPAMRVTDLLFFTPIIESLFLVAVIELICWLHGPLWSQILGSTLVLALLHSVGWKPWGLIVAPSFAIMAFSYHYWRSISRKLAFSIVVCIHALHNLMPAISNLAYAIRHG